MLIILNTLMLKIPAIVNIDMYLNSNLKKLKTLGIATANQYVLASIATKTYFNIETTFSLHGAILFYGLISLFGYLLNFS